MTTDKFDWRSFFWFVVFHVAVLVAAVLLSLFVRTSEVHAEGWFNPGVEGGSGGIGEHDLDGSRLYGDRADDPDTYCWHAAADTWRCVAGGIDVVDITSTGIKVPDDIPLCLGDDDDICIEHDTDGSPDGLRLTQKDCDGSPCNPLEFYKNGGANVIAMRASSFTNPNAKMTFGPPAASGYSLGANDSHFTGRVEIDGSFYAGGESYVGNVNIPYGEILGATSYGVIKPNLSTQTVKTLALLTGSNSNYIFIGSYDDRGTNFGIVKPNDNAVIIQSIDETDITKHSVLFWNRLALGGNGGGLGCINQTFAYDDFVDGGGVVGTFVLDEGIPDGAVVQRAILHTLVPGFTGGANSTATVQIGDGTDPDRYNTGTPSIYTTNASGVDLGAPSGVVHHDDEKDVTVTATVDNDWSTISAGGATVAVCYWTP